MEDDGGEGRGLARSLARSLFWRTNDGYRPTLEWRRRRRREGAPRQRPINQLCPSASVRLRPTGHNPLTRCTSRVRQWTHIQGMSCPQGTSAMGRAWMGRLGLWSWDGMGPARLEERLAKDKLSLLLLRKFGSSERASEPSPLKVGGATTGTVRRSCKGTDGGREGGRKGQCQGGGPSSLRPLSPSLSRWTVHRRSRKASHCAVCASALHADAPLTRQMLAPTTIL